MFVLFWSFLFFGREFEMTCLCLLQVGVGDCLFVCWLWFDLIERSYGGHQETFCKEPRMDVFMGISIFLKSGFDRTKIVISRLSVVREAN